MRSDENKKNVDGRMKAGLYNDDQDDTLAEVGEEHEFEFEDDVDPADRRRDPLRHPH